MLGKFRIQVMDGDTEHVSFSGKRARRRTVLIKVGKVSLSKKAFLLGLLLFSCQVLDGLLTYIGLRMTGHTEGNSILRELMRAYGVAPVLMIAKSFALILVIILTMVAHSRKWLRPLIFCLVVVYLGLAVWPWTYLISKAHAERVTIQSGTIEVTAGKTS